MAVDLPNAPAHATSPPSITPSRTHSPPRRSPSHSQRTPHGQGHGKISRLVGRLRSKSDVHKHDLASSSPDSTERHRFRIHTSSPKTSKPHSPAARADAQASLDLWINSYDYLRDQPGTAGLVMAYEAVVSQELPEHLKVGGMATTLRDHPDERRFELLTSIATAGIAKRRSTTHGLARQIVEEAKDTVDTMLTAYPSSAVAWCGFCTMTPMLLDPMLCQDATRCGIIHVTGRIPWYMYLSQLLLRESWQDHKLPASHAQQTRDSVLRLYRRVLEFEMNCVCAAASVWNKPAKNVVDWNSLPGLISAIEDAEATVKADVELHATEAVQKWLLRCDRDLELSDEIDQQCVAEREVKTSTAT